MGVLIATNSDRRDTRVFPCPYCADGSQTCAMIGQRDGTWFMCPRCGHLVMPGNPHFKCVCANCVEAEQSRSNKHNK
jgi:hypothetical protein